MESQNNQGAQCVVPNGCLVVIGGAESKGEHGDKPPRLSGAGPSVLSSFLNCCGKEGPCVELITTAGTEDIEGTVREYEGYFKELGAKSVGHIHHENREEAMNDKDLVERISKANAVFFSGGDQVKLTSIYGGTPFLTALKNAYINEKLTVGGTSAGAMALSTPMICGGTGEQEMMAGGVRMGTGLEFLKDVCVDTHFVHRGRFVRMAQAIAVNPASIGIGIEEDTAIVVTEGLKARVIGNGVVIVIDGEKINSSNIADCGKKKVTVRNMKVSILSDGETFEIPQRNPPHQ